MYSINWHCAIVGYGLHKYAINANAICSHIINEKLISIRKKRKGRVTEKVKTEAKSRATKR